MSQVLKSYANLMDDFSDDATLDAFVEEDYQAAFADFCKPAQNRLSDSSSSEDDYN